MQLSKLVTYSFDKNVSRLDSAFRVLSGAGLVAFGVLGSVPEPWNIALVVAGGAWFVTGLVSRCGMYYMLGLSTRRTTS